MRPRRTAAEDDFTIRCIGHDIAYCQHDYITDLYTCIGVFLYPKRSDTMPGTKRKGKGDAWYFEVTIGTDFSGKPQRFNKTFHGTEKQAEKELAKFYADCERRKVNKGSTMTVAQLCDLYINEYVHVYLKRSNWKSTSSTVQTHIKPLLGRKKITKVTRLDVQNWINKLAGNNNEYERSPKTIRNYYSVLCGIFKFAVQMDMIENSPCHDIMLPRKQKPEARYYKKDEVELFLTALEKTKPDELKYKAIMYVALFGGLRMGEIMGLDWDDFDAKNKTLNVVRTRMARQGGGIYEDTPKTNKSQRTISLPSDVVDILVQLKNQQAEEKSKLMNKWEDSPAIFKNDMGAPMYPRAPAKWLTAFLSKHNLPYISMHGLRHTHTSLLAYLETDKMSISRRLGHSQLSTTLNIYTHLFEDTDSEIAQGLNIFTENLRNDEKENG